ncbi:MAG: hypothetical protein ACKOE6_03595 [Flammeovirgaceae bacterium]
MKTIHTILFFVTITATHGQDIVDVKSEVRRVFTVYEQQSIPYLHKFAQNLVNPADRNSNDWKYLEHAHFLYYKAKLGVIEGMCSEYLLGKSNSDASMTGKNLRKSIVKYLNDEFKNVYPGLTYEFYEKVKGEVDKF